ncbi:MAG: PqiC family protein [Pseudomonadota bacterium]
MLTTPKRLLAVLALALGACGGPEPVLLPTPAVAPQDRMRIAYASVELRDVSLPSYAAGEDIFLRGVDGTLSRQTPILWADEPEREISLHLSRTLAQLTGAQVASAPWPLSEFPQVQVEVRIEEFVAGADGTFRLTGQYFVAPESGLGRDRTGLFDLTQPIPPETGPQGVAAARSSVISQLARLIAREGLR